MSEADVHDAVMDPQKVATRVIKGLVTMRSAAAKLHTASVDHQAGDMRRALSVIDQEFYELRDYLNAFVTQSAKRAIEPRSEEAG